MRKSERYIRDSFKPALGGMALVILALICFIAAVGVLMTIVRILIG